jgi:hypothetical protein
VEGEELTAKQLGGLLTILERAWGQDTSADPTGWTEENPAFGQCAVTALLIQDVFGGSLCRTTVDGVSHYFNRLPGGQLVDLTFQQFPAGAAYEAISERARQYVMEFEPTRLRYELLRSRCIDQLQAARMAFANPSGPQLEIG